MSERVTVSGARGYSFTTQVRQEGAIGGVPVDSDATNEEVLDALVTAASTGVTGEVTDATAEALADIGEAAGLAVAAVDDAGDAALSDIAAAQSTAEGAINLLVDEAEAAGGMVTTLIAQPFRFEDYEQHREFTNVMFISPSNATGVTPTRITIPATTGNLTMSGQSAIYIPVTPGQDYAVYFEEVTGVPSTRVIRFLNSSAAVLGADITMNKVGGFWVATATAPATAATIRLTVTNTTGSAVVIGRPMIATKKATNLTLGTATITIASPGVVTRTAHGLENGDRVSFTTTGALPTGLSASTIYYVVNKTTDDFQLATSSGGTAINTSGSQSGTHTLLKRVELTKDGVPDSQATAVANLAASTTDDDLANIWFTAAATGSAVARDSGSGSQPVVNADNTITVYADTLIRIRSANTKLVTGDAIVPMIKLARTANPRRCHFTIAGSGGTAVVQLDSLGDGLYGKPTTIPASVGTVNYVQFQVDNLISSYYTAADLTVEWYEMTRGTRYPNNRPSLDFRWPGGQIVIQQSIGNSGGVDINRWHVHHAPSSKLGSRKCIRWNIEEYRESAGGGQGWQLYEFYEATRITDDYFTFTGQRISDQGLHQLAVYEASGSSSSAGFSLGTATITIASPGVITRVAHGLSNGNQVSFTTDGALPTGLVADTMYYVVNRTADTFQVSATSGGSAINTSGSQSGTHTLYNRTKDFMGGTHGYEASGLSLGNPTVSIATPGVVTLTAHGLSNGERVSFTTNGALPTGITAGAVYYVVNAATNTFELSATSGGSSIATSGTQSGTHTVRKRTEVFLVDGNPVTFDGTTTYYGKKFEMIQQSQLIDRSGSGTVKFNVVTRVVFDWEGCTLYQRLVTNGAVSVIKAYTAMLSAGTLFNASGANQWDTFRSLPDFTTYASNSGSGDIITNGDDLQLTGPLGYSIRAKMISGFDLTTWPSRHSRLQRPTSTRKFYFSAPGFYSDGSATGYNLTNGQVIETAARLEIRTVN